MRCAGTRYASSEQPGRVTASRLAGYDEVGMVAPGFGEGEIVRINRSLALAGGVAFAGACGRNDGVTNPGPIDYCTATAPIAISIAVRDSASGRALADSASGTVRLGTATQTNACLSVETVKLIAGLQSLP